MRNEACLGLLVKNGELQQVEIKSSQHIHELIGNWFTSCFTVISPDRPHVWIVGYCDDEFLLREDVSFNVVLESGTLYSEAYPIGGPIVITGVRQRDGETVSLTSTEMQRFFVDHHKVYTVLLGQLPTLRFKGERT